VRVTAELFDKYEAALAKQIGAEEGVLDISGSAALKGPLSLSRLSVSGSLMVESSVTAAQLEVSGSIGIGGDLKADTASISGSLSIGGDTTVTSLEVSGSIDVKGDLRAEIVSVSGSLDVKGDIDASSCEVSGALSAGGNLKAEFLEVSGMCSARGIVRATKAEVYGKLSAYKVEGEEWGVKGGLSIKSDVEVDRLEVLLASWSSIGGVIRGKEVIIREYRSEIVPGILRRILSIVLKVPPLKVYGLRCKGIEAEEVDIERVACDYIRGKRVKIGKGCVVKDKVVYTESLEVDSSAQVKEVVKE